MYHVPAHVLVAIATVSIHVPVALEVGSYSGSTVAHLEPPRLDFGDRTHRAHADTFCVLYDQVLYSRCTEKQWNKESHYRFYEY
jgi:hypothetical protein